ncbi:MAG: hypothetical protein HJJLKODD_00164 [Phycisphaerae bacterium]|nr:hypothetical protein [Phycisphaerae bacterium]
MPTYEYECQACGHRFEAFQSINAEPLSACPKCKKPQAQRMISGGAGILFRGSGFYQTDYRSDSYKQSAKADQPASPAATNSNKSASPGESNKSSTPAPPKSSES